MQHFIITLILVFSVVFFGSAQETKENCGKPNIKVQVSNVLSDDGNVIFALFNKSNFRTKPIQSVSSSIVNGFCTALFEAVEDGEYAIICFHDKNNNKILDFNENGMPIENYGVSNNVFQMGPPQFEESKFLVNGNNVFVEIKF